jgi:hypothetical protein
MISKILHFYTTFPYAYVLLWRNMVLHCNSNVRKSEVERFCGMIKITKIILLAIAGVLLCDQGFVMSQQKAAIKKAHTSTTIAGQIRKNQRNINKLTRRIKQIEAALKKASIQVVSPVAKKPVQKAAKKKPIKVAQQNPNTPPLTQNEILQDDPSDDDDSDDDDDDSDDDDTTATTASSTTATSNT